MSASLGSYQGFGVLFAPLNMLMETVGYKHAAPKHMQYTANTALTQHGKRTYALVEADFPFQLKMDKSLDMQTK